MIIAVLVYLLGYIICGCFIHFMQVIEDKDKYNIKVYLYELAKFSIFSWLGVIFGIAILFVALCCYLDEQIKKYLME